METWPGLKPTAHIMESKFQNLKNLRHNIWWCLQFVWAASLKCQCSPQEGCKIDHFHRQMCLRIPITP